MQTVYAIIVVLAAVGGAWEFLNRIFKWGHSGLGWIKAKVVGRFNEWINDKVDQRIKERDAATLDSSGTQTAREKLHNRLSHLTKDEIAVLQPYVTNPTRTQLLNPEDGTVQVLMKALILVIPSGYYRSGLLSSVMIEDEAFDYLLEHPELVGISHRSVPQVPDEAEKHVYSPPEPSRPYEPQPSPEVIANQPRLEPVGAKLILNGDQLPQRLSADAQTQRVTLQNMGNSIPSDVHVALFPFAANLPPDSPLASRTDELFGTYWEGKLDANPRPGEQMEISLYLSRAPLHGRLNLLEHRTLFAPPNVQGGLHSYFGRLTLTYRDSLGRILASDFDGESVMRGEQLTQVWQQGEGPRVVAEDLPGLSERAWLARKPPVYRGRE